MPQEATVLVFDARKLGLLEALLLTSALDLENVLQPVTNVMRMAEPECQYDEQAGQLRMITHPAVLIK